MEHFYRKMRRQTGLLMDGDKPEGGQWNYDKQNRQRPTADHVFPQVPRYTPDEITEAVIELVKREFADHFGNLDNVWLPVTRKEADHFANDFFENRLDLFGPYEDAIAVGEPSLYHSLLSPLLKQTYQMNSVESAASLGSHT